MEGQGRKAFALEWDEVVKRYGELAAVDGISLRIAKRQLYAILGPNGAGKSTLISIAMGLVKADSGHVRFSGSSVAAGLSQVGLCPQELVIWEGLTVWEQLLFIGSMHGVSRAVARRRADDLLEALGLKDKKRMLASALSGGMKRRLNIMLALMHDPAVLILDEPHAGLDPQSRILVRDFLKTLSASKTVIVTTHDMEETEKIADRAVIIDRGRVLAEDKPSNLIRSVYPGQLLELSLDGFGSHAGEITKLLAAGFPQLKQHGRMLRTESDHPLRLAEKIRERLELAGIRNGIGEIRIRNANLEDVFIAMTGRGLRE